MFSRHAVKVANKRLGIADENGYAQLIFSALNLRLPNIIAQCGKVNIGILT